MNRFYVIGIILMTMVGTASAESSSVSFSGLFVENDKGVNTFNTPAYMIGYTIKNIDERRIENLDLVILGRNESGQIVERVSVPAVWKREQPEGFAPSDELVMFHAMPANNPREDVVSIEPTVQSIKFWE